MSSTPRRGNQPSNCYMAKTANTNSKSVETINQIDWVKDAKTGRQAPRMGISMFASKHGGLTGLLNYPAKGEQRARARFIFGDGIEVWASGEAAQQVVDNFDKTKNVYKKAAVANLEVGEHYVTDQETGERLSYTDEESGELIECTDFMVVKSTAQSGSVAGLLD